MIDFKLKPQRDGDIVVDGYCEDGEHLGGVARVSGIAGGKPKVRVIKAVSLAGLAEILERLTTELKPQVAEAATEPPRATKTRQVKPTKGD